MVIISSIVSGLSKARPRRPNHPLAGSARRTAGPTNGRRGGSNPVPSSRQSGLRNPLHKNRRQGLEHRLVHQHHGEMAVGQATCNSATRTLPFVSGLIRSAMTTLIAAATVPTSIGMTSPTWKYSAKKVSTSGTRPPKITP